MYSKLNKTISIIIVTYFSDYFINDCLSSLFYYNDIDENSLEIIVVDNGPCATSFLKDALKQFNYVRLIENPKNGGFGQGNNIGADASSGELLLFLNPDTKFVEPVFSEVINIFNNNYDVRAVGCQLIDSEGRRNNTYGYFPENENIFTLITDKYVFKPLGYIPKHSVYPWGADFFVRREDFYAAGKFDEKFFLCFEEADLCKRLENRKTYICNKKILHYEGHTTEDQSIRFDVWLQSLQLYHKKYGYDLTKTLRKYHFILLARLVRCFFSKQDRVDVRGMIKKIKILREYSLEV